MRLFGIELWQGNIAGMVTYATFTAARKRWDAAKADLAAAKRKNPSKPKKWENEQKKVDKAWLELQEIGRKLNRNGKLPPADALLIGEQPSPQAPSTPEAEAAALVEAEAQTQISPVEWLTGVSPLALGVVGLVGLAAAVAVLKRNR